MAFFRSILRLSGSGQPCLPLPSIYQPPSARRRCSSCLSSSLLADRFVNVSVTAPALLISSSRCAPASIFFARSVTWVRSFSTSVSMASPGAANRCSFAKCRRSLAVSLCAFTPLISPSSRAPLTFHPTVSAMRRSGIAISGADQNVFQPVSQKLVVKELAHDIFSVLC